MINEKKYPTLSWSSFRPGFEPENLLIAALNEETAKFMKSSIGFHNFIGLLGFDYYQGNSLRDRMKKEVSLPSYEPHRNFYLSNKAFDKVEDDANFRMKVWNMNVSIPSGSGSILFRNGGAYLYRILSPEDTIVYHLSGNMNFDFEGAVAGARYFAVALFLEDNFVCWEEGLILPNGGLSIPSTGNYPVQNELGQYISFTIITLKSFWGNIFKSRTLAPKIGLNESSQKINYLE